MGFCCTVSFGSEEGRAALESDSISHSMSLSILWICTKVFSVLCRFATDAQLDAGSFPTPLCIGVGVGTDFEFDANMAHIDMEDFHSQDILLRFPPLCASDLQVGPH